MTDLHAAARSGDVSAVVELVTAHPEFVSAVDRHNRQPLHLAAWAGHVDVVDLLLSFEADVNAQAMDAATPLIFAIQKGRVAVVQSLVKAGANVNVRMTKNFKTPLMLAAQLDNEAIVKLLLANGARPKMKDKGRRRAADYARDETIRFMIQRKSKLAKQLKAERARAAVAEAAKDSEADAKVEATAGDEAKVEATAGDEAKVEATAGDEAKVEAPAAAAASPVATKSVDEVAESKKRKAPSLGGAQADSTGVVPEAQRPPKRQRTTEETPAGVES